VFAEFSTTLTLQHFVMNSPVCPLPAGSHALLPLLAAALLLPLLAAAPAAALLLPLLAAALLLPLLAAAPAAPAAHPGAADSAHHVAGITASGPGGESASSHHLKDVHHVIKGKHLECYCEQKGEDCAWRCTSGGGLLYPARNTYPYSCVSRTKHGSQENFCKITKHQHRTDFATVHYNGNDVTCNCTEQYNWKRVPASQVTGQGPVWAWAMSCASVPVCEHRNGTKVDEARLITKVECVQENKAEAVQVLDTSDWSIIKIRPTDEEFTLKSCTAKKVVNSHWDKITESRCQCKKDGDDCAWGCKDVAGNDLPAKVNTRPYFCEFRPKREGTVCEQIKHEENTEIVTVEGAGCDCVYHHAFKHTSVSDQADPLKAWAMSCAPRCLDHKSGRKVSNPTGVRCDEQHTTEAVQALNIRDSSVVTVMLPRGEFTLKSCTVRTVLGRVVD